MVRPASFGHTCRAWPLFVLSGWFIASSSITPCKSLRLPSVSSTLNFQLPRPRFGLTQRPLPPLLPLLPPHKRPVRPRTPSPTCQPLNSASCPHSSPSTATPSRLIRPGLDLGSIPFFHKPLQLNPKQTPLGGEPIVLKEQGAPRQATTPIAKAAAQTAQAIVPAAPKADKVEIAALELLLAEPQNQAMVREFGGKLEPLPTWTTVGQGIEARYGQDLGSRLYQLQNAQRAVEGKFFTAMDQALQNPPPAPPPFSTLNQLRGQPEPVSAQPGWTYEPGSRHWDGAGPSWRFDPGAFSRAWAAGDSAAQKAFAHLHGPDALKYVPEPNAEGGASAHWELADRPVVLGRALDREEGLTPDAVAGAQAGSHNSAQSPGWAPSRVQRADTELDPSRITKLIDKEFVWFDPQRGFCTDADNLKQSGIDKAFPYIFAAAMTAMSFGAGSTLAATVSSAAGGGTTGAMAVGATGAFISNASLQLAANGKINFGQLLRSTLAGGATAGLLDVTGLNSVPEGATLGQRLMNYTGRATLQGAIQSVMGGKFRDGFVNSMMGSVAAEVSQQLNSHIAQLEGNGSLSASEASAMRLLSRATGSALRIAGSADPAAGFASDFLGGLMHDGLAAHQPNTDAAGSAPPADPLGDFIADNQQAWSDRQARYDQVLQAFTDAQSADRSQDVQVAAGPGFSGLSQDGPQPDGSYRVTITGTATEAAQEELSRIDQLLRGSGTDVSRAALYNDLVLDKFRDMSAADQRAVLAQLDNYANALHDVDALTRAGVAPGSMEARRADLAVRIAADFARQSGAIPDNARFPADARAGMETGLAAMIGAVAGRRGISREDRHSLFESAESPFRGQTLTNAGRATTKHPEYFGFNSTEEMRGVYRTDSELNSLARRAVDEILTNGVRTSGAGGRYPDGWITYTLPDGRAASWTSSGEFIGFRGVKK